MGGNIGGTYGNDVWYSTDGNTWTQATYSAAWSDRASFEALVYDNKMWVLGGLDTGSSGNNDVWYSTDGNTWTQATSSAGWSTRWSSGSVVHDNKMWIFGGYDGSHKNDVWHTSE